MSAQPLLCGITVGEPEAGMGSCTRHSLSVSAESAERPSPSQMQRCKVIPPTRQNRNHIVQLQDQFYRKRNNKYGDRVGENYAIPAHWQQY